MARSLIILLVAILTMGSSCQTSMERLTGAATVQGQTRAQIPPLTTPDSCVAHMERAVPKLGEKARWTQKRWEILADNRDRLADDCQAVLDAYWEALSKISG